MNMKKGKDPSPEPNVMGEDQATPLGKEMITKLKALIWAARDAIVMMDHQGRISFWNPAAEKIFGYESDEVLGRDLHRVIVPPKYREKHRRAFPEYLRSGKGRFIGKIMELNALRKDGKQIPVEMSLSCVKIQGEWQAVAVIRDIRQRKKAERALEETKEKYRAVFENTGAATLIIEKDTTISLVNKKFEELFGYPKREVEGKKSWTEFVAKDELQRMKHYHDLRRKDSEAAPKRYRFRFKTREGKIGKGLAAIDTIKGTEKTVASIIDITDQEETRFELERRLEFERAIAKISSRFVAAADIDEAINLTLRDIGQLSGASRSYLFLLEEDGSIRNSHQWCAPGIESRGESLATRSLPLWAEKIQDMENPKEVDIKELWQEAGAKGNSDALFTGSLLLLPIGNEGDLVGFAEFDNVKKTTEWSEEDRAVLSTVCNMIGTALERKWAQEEIERYSHHLEDLVDERTRQLKKRERMAAIGQTTAMVGHDLRNPLQVVVNNIYLAKKAIEQDNPKVALERLKVIERRAGYMNKIVSDLQDFSRPIKPEPITVDFPKLIQDAVDGVEIPENVEVQTDFGNGLGELLADPSMVNRILINLVTNAVQAMPDGGELGISTSGDEKNAYLRIRDTGMGISDESMDKIFDPMYTTKAQGQGFGLPVCKKLAEAHGGNISVQSTENQGTTFTLALPRYQGQQN